MNIALIIMFSVVLMLATLLVLAGRNRLELEHKLHICSEATLDAMAETDNFRHLLTTARKRAQSDEELNKQLIQVHMRQEEILRTELSKVRRAHLASDLRLDDLITKFLIVHRAHEQLKLDHAFLWERATALFIGEISPYDKDRQYEEIENPMVQYAHDYSDQLAEQRDSYTVLDAHPDW